MNSKFMVAMGDTIGQESSKSFKIRKRSMLAKEASQTNIETKKKDAWKARNEKTTNS